MSAATAERISLSAAQRQEYADRGFLVVPGVFSAGEIAEASAEAERLLGRTDLIDVRNLPLPLDAERAQRTEKARSREDECLFETFDPVIDLSAVCARIARHPRLLAILAELYGEPAKLFKDKLIFKPPRAKGYDLHQDFIAWPNFPRSFLTAAVAIDPCDLDNGCTVAYPDYHQRGCLSPEDGDYHSLPPDAVDASAAVPLELMPGDVAFFGCFTPHSSAPNTSGRWRRLLYLSYNAESDGGDRRETHYAEFLVWLRKKYAEYGKTNVYFA